MADLLWTQFGMSLRWRGKRGGERRRIRGEGTERGRV